MKSTKKTSKTVRKKAAAKSGNTGKNGCVGKPPVSGNVGKSSSSGKKP